MLLAVATIVTAQSVRFELDGTIFEDGETVISEYLEDYGEYQAHMQIRNLTDHELNIIVEREVIETYDDVLTYFCWGQCFAPDVNVSRPAVPVPANAVSDGNFEAHVMFPEVEAGVVVVKYYAYDENTPEDRVSITILAGQTAETTENKVAVGHAYPNPASNKVSFNIQHAGMVEATVYNLLGQEVMTQTVNSQSQSQVSFSVEDLQAGIYFCNFIANGEVLKTEKFIVKH